MTTRHDGRTVDALRIIDFQVGIAPHATGSVLVKFGSTQVICSAMIEDKVPRWMKEQGVTGGWVTAEYSMLPYSTLDRKQRDISKGKADGRSIEIQRLIGRALRASVDLELLGSRTLWVDCDVLQADGGTRTASITGASVAVALACRQLMAAGKLAQNPVKKLVSAVSVGVVDGVGCLDLDYVEDKDANVDANFVFTEAMEFVEVQASGEEAVFGDKDFEELIRLAKAGATRLFELQREVMEKHAALLPPPAPKREKKEKPGNGFSLANVLPKNI